MAAMRLPVNAAEVHFKPPVIAQNVIIRSKNVDIHANRQGTAASSVFLHGFAEDLRTWDGVWQELGHESGSLRYDLRGFGNTLCPDTPFRHADDLLALLDATNTRDCDLIGVSDGGGVALNFTLDHPERVRRLILLSPALVAWEWSELWKKLWEAIVVHARRGDLMAARRLWWEHPLFEPTRGSPAAAVLFDSIMRFPGRQWIHDHQVMQLPDVDRLYLLETPTLLLTAGRDMEDFKLIAALIEASSPNVRRLHYPAGGHLLHLENPKECAHQIRSFLTG